MSSSQPATTKSPTTHHLPFILYAPQRTGSTTIARLLNCHPGLRCEFEPFNPGFLGPTVYLCQTLLKTQGIAAAIAALWQACNGIKHIWHPDGWPFLGDPTLNHRLLVSCATSIILLRRRNLLRRAISGQISAQMDIWIPRTNADRRNIRAHQFRPLDIDLLRDDIASERLEYARSRELAVTCGKRWTEIFYEDFFSPGMPMDVRLEAVQKLFDFLNIPRVTDEPRLAQMQILFDPAVTGFQNDLAYEKIPNIAQVEKELATPETGFIFEPPHPTPSEI